MLVADFDFDLPKDLIAQAPPEVRGQSRLLVVDRAAAPGQVTHRMMSDLPSLLRAGDLLVVNDTKVFPARLLGRRTPSGGAVECMLLERVTGEDGEPLWNALMHPGQKLKVGGRFTCGQTQDAAAGAGAGTDTEARRDLEPPYLHGEIVGRGSFGHRTVRLWSEDGAEVDSVIDRLIDRIGHLPLPPYIHRPDSPEDAERYQTVYARARGSVAAPTAGLHFTPELFAALDAHGVERAAITLHVGYGTFKPVRAEVVEEHVVDAERFDISGDTAARINKARAEGRRVIAVGTTTTRALESAARAAAAEVEASGAPASSASPGLIRPGPGVTSLFIHPGHEFRAVDALVTNFHLPRSSLLMLVAAFAGRERVLAAYQEAIAGGYRFYSYGDAMLIV
jgi:S-adenosylmethionine:tRNA ribosyltransferase-isomerase